MLDSPDWSQFQSAILLDTPEPAVSSAAVSHASDDCVEAEASSQSESFSPPGPYDSPPHRRQKLDHWLKHSVLAQKLVPVQAVFFSPFAVCTGKASVSSFIVQRVYRQIVDTFFWTLLESSVYKELRDLACRTTSILISVVFCLCNSGLLRHNLTWK